MLDTNKINSFKKEYRYIYIIENRNLFDKSILDYNERNDLILCTDFGLFKNIDDHKSSIAYLDNLADKESLDKANSEMNWFLNNWYKDIEKVNILDYKGFNIGDALLLNVLNEITCFCHYFYNIICLKEIKYKKIFLLNNDIEIQNILNFLNIEYKKVNSTKTHKNFPIYSFPISKWFDNAVNNILLKKKAFALLSEIFDTFFNIFDSLFVKRKKNIYVQNYHPTKNIIQELSKTNNHNIILSNFTREISLFKQRRLSCSSRKKHKSTNKYLEALKVNKIQKWIYNNYDLSEYLYPKLVKIVQQNINHSLLICDSITTFSKKRSLSLMIPITNLWLENRLLMLYCKNNKIPVFMIINGLLNIDHWKDGHDSDFVNCYSTSIHEDYFKNKENVVGLGDPRMDKYANSTPKKIDTNTPTITIGAAGFDNIDLNSYLAFEFDFLYDILEVLKNIKAKEFSCQILLKVRANGYANVYGDFIDEYFPDLNIEIEQNIPFVNILLKTDLYISFYSQTIIEAAASGIPTIYYKKDHQTIHRPFNGKSELVTSTNKLSLEKNIISFYNNDSIYKPFLEKIILEKYIGPLDGKNTERNMNFIDSILKQHIT